MQIERFESFVEELAGVAGTYTPVASEYSVFRFFGDAWYAEDGSILRDEALVALLAKARRQGKHMRERKSPVCCFYLAELDVVIKATFDALARINTRDKYWRALQETLKHAKDAFDAIHDRHTGLLNKEGFKTQLHSAIESIVTTPEEAVAQTETRPAGGTVSLLSIDIDYFKQVNDSYGHDYGDVVLECFARRLHQFARELSKESSASIRTHVARAGGEEFSVLLSGSVSIEDAKRIASQINQAIANTPLPSDSELEDVQTSNITRPPEADRKITVSIGMDSLSTAAPGQVEQASRTLRVHADTAMYCAKAGGRNRYRHFSEIMSKYGTVLEHHKDTDVVTIDLGALVGVRAGQDFRVYHPDFTGESPFVLRDGRTEKRLGKYPRLSNGRIIAFEVQENIAFCHVDPDHGRGPFPAGARLEAVPVGSISHLIASSLPGHLYIVPDLPRASQLATTVGTMAEAGVKLGVGIFTLNAYTALVDARGTAFVNDCLVRLYEGLRAAYPNSAEIAQTSATEFAVVCPDLSPADAVEVAEEATRDAAQRCQDAATFSAGLYISGYTAEASGADKSSPSPEHALEYAAVAVSVAQGTPGAVKVFTPDVASESLLRARRDRKYEHALEDYAKLQELGIDYSLLANQAALAATEKDPPDARVALEAISHAVALEPDRAILWANKGYITFLFLDRALAYDDFAAMWKLTPDYELNDIYVPIGALAMFEKYQHDASAIDKTKLEDMLDRALTVVDSTFPRYAEELLVALKSLQGDSSE